MKKLIVTILCLVSLQTYAYNTHEEIDALSLDDLNVFWMCVYKVNKPYNCSYNYDVVSQSATPYRTSMEIVQPSDPECVVPAVTVLNNKLANYKLDLHAELTERLAYASCKADAKARFESMRHRFHRLRKLAGLTHKANPAAWFRDIWKVKTTSEQCETWKTNQLAPMEAQVTTAEAEDAAEQITKNEVHQAKLWLKDADCTTWDPTTNNKLRFYKNACIWFKRKFRNVE